MLVRLTSRLSRCFSELKVRSETSVSEPAQAQSSTPIHLRPYNKSKYEVVMNKIKINSGTVLLMQDMRLLRSSLSPGRRSWKLAIILWSSSALDSQQIRSIVFTMRKERNISWKLLMKLLMFRFLKISSELRSLRYSLTTWSDSSRWSTLCATAKSGSSKTIPPLTNNWSRLLLPNSKKNTLPIKNRKGLVLHSSQSDQLILTILLNFYYLFCIRPKYYHQYEGFIWVKFITKWLMRTNYSFIALNRGNQWSSWEYLD